MALLRALSGRQAAAGWQSPRPQSELIQQSHDNRLREGIGGPTRNQQHTRKYRSAQADILARITPCCANV